MSQTLIELLVKEFLKATPPKATLYSMTVPADLHTFSKFAHDYLDRYRMSSVNYQMDSNCLIRLSNGEECTLSPILERGSLPNTDYQIATGVSPEQEARGNSGTQQSYSQPVTGVDK